MLATSICTKALNTQKQSKSVKPSGGNQSNIIINLLSNEVKVPHFTLFLCFI